jgi:hypothetical protein
MTDPQPPAAPQPPDSASRFPTLALATSGVLLLAVAVGAQPAEQGMRFPLLALLALCEFGAIINLVGAYLGFRRVQARGLKPGALLPFAASLCAAGVFVWLGLWLWPL